MKSIEFVPGHLRDNELIQIICDLIDQVNPTDNDIEELLYRYDWNISSGNYQSVLYDLGYQYIVDTFGSVNNPETLLFFMHMINQYKGRVEGFDLIMGILGLSYTIRLWNEGGTGSFFTYDLDINATQSVITAELYERIKRFCYNYLLPQLNIINFISDTVKGDLNNMAVTVFTNRIEVYPL